MKNRIFFIVANLIGLIVLCHQLCLTQTVYGGLRIKPTGWHHSRLR